MADITERLRELSKARWDKDAWERETTVRIPAEPDRDIDLVLANAAAEIDRLRARVAELEAERADDDALRERMADTLKRTAIALRGPEPPLTAWSWHDLPERAAAAIASIGVFQRVAHNLADPRDLHNKGNDVSLHAVDCDYAHRLATMLECALLNRLGSWDEGHALLDEYRAACRAVMPDAPTFMGEPVIDDVFTAELVEIDGHTYGLRPGAARVVREALASSDPELDGTDFAHPAWWRGHDNGSLGMIAAVTRILDGKDDGRGVANEPWQSVRTRLREAMRDAGRYRWLRQPNALERAAHIAVLTHNGGYVATEGFADASIDAAMAKDGA